MLHRIHLLFFALLVAVGCSESRNDRIPATDAGTGSDSGGTDSGPPGLDSTVPDTDSGGPGTDAGGPRSDLAINEIRAVGDDWIELYNAGPTVIDLGGMKVADAETDGSARADRAVIIPAGVTLDPGAFFFVLADQPVATTDLSTDCMVAGVSECVHSDWGISRTDGDTIFVLDAGDAVVTSAEYPGGVIPDMTEQSWGRLPDGTGDFAINTPTPNAPNAAAM